MGRGHVSEIYEIVVRFDKIKNIWESFWSAADEVERGKGAAHITSNGNINIGFLFFLTLTFYFGLSKFNLIDI